MLLGDELSDLLQHLRVAERVGVEGGEVLAQTRRAPGWVAVGA